MANLIITIISIALVAVAALMGAYYGGQAFMEGQRKAQVNMIVNAGRQIAAAWQIWATERGTSDLPGATATLIEDNLIPAYLSSLPQIPESLTDTSQSDPLTKKFTARCTSAFSTGACSPRNFVRIFLNSAELCRAISQLAGGSSYTPPRATSNDFSALGKRPFDCIWRDFDNDSVMSTPNLSTTDVYVFMYVAF